MREIDVIGPATRLQENRILFKCDRLELRRQQTEIRWRERRQKAVTNSAWIHHQV